ncbi:hypothetical protein MSAN_01614900 [Mycena sanguinolenta]|uniref:Uncharacterized protein n=1 Tax=Mycena sanguinolenta TaxID=230812 RepID=A0A8H6XYB2_9AGAR|nr:hypothetical protein MSAN_01614900 [Mycena sanguinolenta]
MDCEGRWRSRAIGAGARRCNELYKNGHSRADLCEHLFLSPIPPSSSMRLSEKDMAFPPPYESPRYVYYRVYAPYGAILSKTAPDPTQPSIGRIKATSVPPPLNVASLKRTLAHAEGIPDPLGLRSDLYRLPGEQTPMDDMEAVAILGPGGVAPTWTDAVALVFVDEFSEEEELNLPKIEEGIALGAGTQDCTGEDHSTRAFDPEELALGRIDLSTIAPPRDAQAIKRCIARAERKPIYAFADLYADLSQGPLESNASNFTGDGQFCGSSAADAMRIVQPERRPGLYNRPLKVIQPQAQRRQLPSRAGQQALTWLEARIGEIVNTDGILHWEGSQLRFGFGDPGPEAAYTAVDSSGVKGLIKPENVTFLDE